MQSFVLSFVTVPQNMLTQDITGLRSTKSNAKLGQWPLWINGLEETELKS